MRLAIGMACTWPIACTGRLGLKSLDIGLGLNGNRIKLGLALLETSGKQITCIYFKVCV
jgi:hypothetical protein